MNSRALQLKPAAAPVRAVGAVYLAGGDSAAWLAELAGWAVPHEELPLFLVPRSAQDRTAGGLLVLLPAGTARPVGARGLLLGALEGRLFLPVDAELSPPLTSTEVEALCRAEVTLFHPGLGVVEFAAEDRRQLWDLLERPTLAPAADWNCAAEGAALNSRLAGVTLRTLPQGQDIYGSAGTEIGRAPATGLPPAKGEPSNSPLARLGRAVRGMGAAAAGKLFAQIPQTGTRRTWINDAMDWAAAKLARVSSDMEQLRQRELNRLAELLDSDPERGLRHALPLGGAAEGRGRAQPGAQLGTNDPRFDLARLGGGGPGDPWSMPAELRQRLLDKYRELALREQRLGNFQRAAYIHAHLLGDLSAAAAVLKEGRWFAEAAAVYRDHLRQPAAAAQCYESGGFFAEALAIYEKQGNDLAAGDLHRRLGDEAAAVAAFRRVIALKREANDHTTAAALLENRLHAPDEALAVLHEGWPGSSRALECLDAEFSLLGRLGRHEAARQRIAVIAETVTPLIPPLTLAAVMHSVYRTYPDHTVRPAAADLARVKISAALPRVNAEEVNRGLQLLRELAPEDQLLARDTSRFAGEFARTHWRPSPYSSQPRSAPEDRPKLIDRFHLPKFESLLTAAPFGGEFVALVSREQKPYLVRGNWQGTVIGTEWEDGRLDAEGHALLFEKGSAPPYRVVPFSRPLPGRRPCPLPSPPGMPSLMSAEVPAWLPDETFALAHTTGRWWLLRPSAEEIILECRTGWGELINSLAITQWLQQLTEPDGRACLAAHHDQVWIGLGQRLLHFNGAREPRLLRCQSPIRALEPCARFLPQGVLARCESGVCVFWAERPENETALMAAHLAQPVAAFLGNSTLVVLATVSTSETYEGEVILVNPGGLHRSTDFLCQIRHPHSLLPTDSPTGFAVFSKSGVVQVFEMPSGRG